MPIFGIMKSRPRRNRKSQAIRAMICETHLDVKHLIYPLFVQEGVSMKKELISLPGNFIWSPDTILTEIDACMALGIQSFVLFPKVAAHNKDKTASYAADPDNFYLNTARSIKKKYPECVLISDVAMDPYSSDGHDGIVENGKIDNDKTLSILQDMSIAQAKAGFDILGPSDMMDGRIGALRDTLDQSGFEDVSLMAYTAKYASSFYGPFRDALDSAPVQDPNIPKDKKTYQMDPANQREAIIEATLDTAEGADFLMIKPAVHYMDIIHLIRQHADLPIAAYHVSGECAMLIAAAQKGWLDFNTAMPETLLSLRRAGANVILTYFAKSYAQLVKKGEI